MDTTDMGEKLLIPDSEKCSLWLTGLVFLFSSMTACNSTLLSSVSPGGGCHIIGSFLLSSCLLRYLRILWEQEYLDDRYIVWPLPYTYCTFYVFHFKPFLLDSKQVNLLTQLLLFSLLCLFFHFQLLTFSLTASSDFCFVSKIPDHKI